MSDYYDKQGKPLDREQYFELLKTSGPDYKRVAFTKVGDIDISTVWLGLDHRYGDGDPVIFETMQFGGDAGGDADRYCTLEEARAGHVAWVKQAMDLTDDVDVLHDQEQASFVASCGEKHMPRAYADAEFIAAAPADVAYLLDLARKQAAALEAVIALAHEDDWGRAYLGAIRTALEATL